MELVDCSKVLTMTVFVVAPMLLLSGMFFITSAFRAASFPVTLPSSATAEVEQSHTVAEVRSDTERKWFSLKALT